MKSMFLNGFVFLIVLALFGCGDGNVVKRDGQPDMVRVKSEDAKMNAAVQQARDSLQVFLEALKSPKGNQSHFAVKKRFPLEGDAGEHIWLIEPSYDGRNIHGKVNNKPVDVTNVKLGDPASVAASEITDWMFVEDRKLKGGYTIRALYDLSSAAGRKRFEKETGLRTE
jgi:uncharacterized protein YegJ (DUF2314 family)